MDSGEAAQAKVKPARKRTNKAGVAAPTVVKSRHAKTQVAAKAKADI